MSFYTINYQFIIQIQQFNCINKKYKWFVEYNLYNIENNDFWMQIQFGQNDGAKRIFTIATAPLRIPAQDTNRHLMLTLPAPLSGGRNHESPHQGAMTRAAEDKPQRDATANHSVGSVHHSGEQTHHPTTGPVDRNIGSADFGLVSARNGKWHQHRPLRKVTPGERALCASATNKKDKQALSLYGQSTVSMCEYCDTLYTGDMTS